MKRTQSTPAGANPYFPRQNSGLQAGPVLPQSPPSDYAARRFIMARGQEAEAGKEGRALSTRLLRTTRPAPAAYDRYRHRHRHRPPPGTKAAGRNSLPANSVARTFHSSPFFSGDTERAPDALYSIGDRALPFDRE